mgnify:CR=1 FL=1
MSDFLKQPSEEFTVALDFSGDLETGETVASKTVTASDIADGSDQTAAVIVSSSIDGTKVRVRVRAGTDGHDYKITATVTTNLSQVYEHEVTMRVREL